METSTRDCSRQPSWSFGRSGPGRSHLRGEPWRRSPSPFHRAGGQPFAVAPWAPTLLRTTRLLRACGRLLLLPFRGHGSLGEASIIPPRETANGTGDAYPWRPARVVDSAPRCGPGAEGHVDKFPTWWTARRLYRARRLGSRAMIVAPALLQFPRGGREDQHSRSSTVMSCPARSNLRGGRLSEPRTGAVSALERVPSSTLFADLTGFRRERGRRLVLVAAPAPAPFAWTR